MDQNMYCKYRQYTESIRVILSLLQQQHGQLELISSRIRKDILCSIEDEIAISVARFLKNRLKMYNIKIFFRDSIHETNYTFSPVFAMYYNYLLLNTNFSSQYLLRKDMTFGHVVYKWPTLSPDLFIQIIWYSNCEDLLIESIVHIPLDLCTEILEITIKHIDKLAILRARRLIFLLIYKIYNKCLWLHLGTLSAQNVMERVQQLIMYFEILLNLFVSLKFVTFRNLSTEKKYQQHGILVKNILHCIEKCMHSKIESYSENHNLPELFTLTYGNEYTNYYHMLPPNEVKCIIIRLDQKLATVLLNQIKHVNSSEYTGWRNIIDDEKTIISLYRVIIMKCHSLKEFMKQNNFLVQNEQLFLCLKQLIGSMKSEKSILTLQELCHDIAKGKSHGIKELMKRYKEWDLSTLNFIGHSIILFSLDDFYVIVEYLYYKFAYLRTEIEKYHVYMWVLNILIQLDENDMCSIILKCIMLHFDDNCLEYLYDERSFDIFLQQNLVIEEFNNSRSIVINAQRRAFLTFMLLNPKDVLSKLIIHEINMESSVDDILFQRNIFVSFIYNCYRLRKDQCDVLTYILKNIILQQHVILHTNFSIFINKILNSQVIYTML